MESPEHLDKMDKTGLVIKIMIGGEYQKYMLEMHERVEKLIGSS